MKKFKVITLGLLAIAFAGGAVVSASNHNLPELRNIIGSDDRTYVTDTRIAPYSSIAQTQIYTTSGYRYGSGTVINKNIVLTAGHVAAKFKPSSKSASYVIPGKNGKLEPFGRFKVKEAYHMTFSDIGVLILEKNEKGKNIGDLVPQQTVAPAAKVGDQIHLSGYGGDKGGQQWLSKGKITEEDESNWYYDADATPGNSGSPVFNQKNEIIAVHVYGFKDSNGASKIQGGVYDFVKKYLGIQSNTPPVSEISAPTLTGVTDKEITVGDNFDKLAGVKASDEIDGDLTAKIQVTGNLDTQKVGKYTLTYSVTNSKGKKTTAQRTITVKEKSSIPTPNPTPSGNEWNANKIYLAGDIVTYKGKTYKAKWWTKNNAPDSSSAWEQISAPSADGSVDYVAGKAYTSGTLVKYKGHIYKAKWWTTSTPGSDSSWEKIS